MCLHNSYTMSYEFITLTLMTWMNPKYAKTVKNHILWKYYFIFRWELYLVVFKYISSFLLPPTMTKPTKLLNTKAKQDKVCLVLCSFSVLFRSKSFLFSYYFLPEHLFLGGTITNKICNLHKYTTICSNTAFLQGISSKILHWFKLKRITFQGKCINFSEETWQWI